MSNEIIFENRHFASIHNFDEIEEGLSFLTNDDSFIQVELGIMTKIKFRCSLSQLFREKFLSHSGSCDCIRRKNKM